MNAHTLPPFRSRRVPHIVEPERVILRLLGKAPRTTEELAYAVCQDVITTSRLLSRMAEAGQVVKAEQRCKYQIWEATTPQRTLTTRKPSEAISRPAGEAHGAKEARGCTS